ncbi:hypothetical protein [Marinicellulosiphila megalodicopiae]|uniref:hypothetical protein n=1 Tax=Marinicellulosiphila megalodicopiae TaxID=2724896 RepID=UPI003BB1D64F
MSDNITVGPVINMAKYTLGTDSISLFGLGARGEYFMDGRDVNSFYTAVEMTYGTISTDVSSVDCSLSNFDAVAFGGYAWRWDSGMSVKLGGGLRQTVYLEDAYACDDGSTEGVGFETEGIITGFGLDFTVGKSF